VTKKLEILCKTKKRTCVSLALLACYAVLLSSWRETAATVDHSNSKQHISSLSPFFFHHPSIIDLLHVLSFQQVMENGLDVSPA